MLTNLHIENIAIIDNLDVDMTSGFVVLTGETGAGKSIIIDAINMLLGDRVSRDIVRTGEKKAFVSAVFTDIDSSVLKMLTDLGYDAADELILSRELSAEGRSVARINGRPVSVAVLRDIGTKLVNIHGQHDNTALLDPDIHIHFLDKYAKNENAKNEYLQAYTKAVTLKRKIENLTANDAEKEHRTDILKYQINEIETADLKENEDKTLEQRQEVLVNAEKILASLNIIKRLLAEDDLNIHDMLSSCVRESKLLCRYDATQNNVSEKLIDAAAYLDEVTDLLNSYSDKLDFDPNELYRNYWTHVRMPIPSDATGECVQVTIHYGRQLMVGSKDEYIAIDNVRFTNDGADRELSLADKDGVMALKAEFDGMSADDQYYVTKQRVLKGWVKQIEEMEAALLTGDVDDNGEVNAVDALMVLKAAVGKTTLTDLQTLVADVDKSGLIDAVDALKILKIAVGK